MSLLPPGVDSEELMTYIRSMSNELLKDPLEVHSLEFLRTRWLTADRVQFATKNHVSVAGLAFTLYSRALAQTRGPPLDEVNGDEFLAAGILVEDEMTPALYSQTRLVDTITALRSQWLSCQTCGGISQLIEALLFRGAVLMNNALPNTVLDDARFSADIPDTELCVGRKIFGLDLETFFFDAITQLQLISRGVPALENVDAVVAEAVRVHAVNSLYRCKLHYATLPWFHLYWELRVAPGEREAYHREKPSAPTEARQVISLHRAYELLNTEGQTCSLDTLADTTNPLSMVTLCARKWKTAGVKITHMSEPIDGPSLRFVCGELAYVDKDDVFTGNALAIVTIFLQRKKEFIDMDTAPRKNLAVSTNQQYTAAE
jgi:hypothetical protein